MLISIITMSLFGSDEYRPFLLTLKVLNMSCVYYSLDHSSQTQLLSVVNIGMTYRWSYRVRQEAIFVPID